MKFKNELRIMQSSSFTKTSVFEFFFRKRNKYELHLFELGVITS